MDATRTGEEAGRRQSVMLPLKLQSSSGGRECGGCTACCTACAVVPLNKPVNVAWVHLAGGGCGIYDSRPSPCRVFRCAWLQGLLPEKFRPDQSGVVWAIIDRTRDAITLQAMLLSPDVPMERVEY